MQLSRHAPSPAGIRKAALTVAMLASAAWTASGLAATGRLVKGADNPPSEATPLRAEGTFCRADSKNFRVWWSDAVAATATGALTGADGSCATLPPAAQGVLSAAETYRVIATVHGFPAMIGDAAPRFARNRSAYNSLRRLGPDVRGRSLSRLSPTLRGRLLAGFTVNERRVVLRGLSRVLRLRLTRDATVAVAGRPKDYVGGDRRLDITLDRTGVTGEVGDSRKGVAPCRYALIAGKRRFVAASTVILAPDAGIPRATLAHELFHAVQCVLNASGVGLVQEGTAEWFGALAEPGDFAGQIDVSGTITGGATRVISFCREFDPSRKTALDVYNSWAVWTALELAVPGGVENAVRSGGSTAQAIMSGVGDAAWSAAVLLATRELCGNLRSPSGAPVFAPKIRDVFAAGRPIASPGVPVATPAPPGGTASVVGDWPTGPPPAQVVIRLTAPGIAPDALASRLVAQAGATVLTVTSDPTATLVTLPAADILTGRALITIANPSIATPVTVTTEVTVTP